MCDALPWEHHILHAILVEDIPLTLLHSVGQWNQAWICGIMRSTLFELKSVDHVISYLNYMPRQLSKGLGSRGMQSVYQCCILYCNIGSGCGLLQNVIYTFLYKKG